MTIEQQIELIIDFARKARDAQGQQASNIRRKMLEKIELIARDLRLLDESGDRPLD